MAVANGAPLSARYRRYARLWFALGWPAFIAVILMVEIASYEYIIIGAGSAGCVLAYRLGERPENNILVLEAGSKDHFWNWKIHMGRAIDDNDVVGGGGALDLGGRTPAADAGDGEAAFIGAVEGLLPGGEPGGEAALGIGVEQRDAAAGLTPGDGQLRRQRRLADAALLLRDREHAGCHVSHTIVFDFVG